MGGISADSPFRTARLRLTDGSAEPFGLAIGSTVVGRTGGGADIQFTESSLSRRHFVITFDGRDATLLDAGSASGTYVNRNSLPRGGCRLVDGDVIRAGHVTMVFELAGPPG